MTTPPGAAPGPVPRISVGAGTAVEMLMAAAAVADPDWRSVFHTGEATWRSVVGAAGRPYARRLAAPGRFGWINLLALASQGRGAFSVERLLTSVQGSQPSELHLTMLGGRRRQLNERFDDHTLIRAIEGEPDAARRLSRFFASDDTVLTATPWLLRTPSSSVHREVVSLLETWSSTVWKTEPRTQLARTLRAAARTSRARLAALAPADFLQEVAGGLTYEPGGARALTVVPSTLVSPVVVVVDGLDRGILVFPAPGPTGQGDGARLLTLTRAIGDDTRTKILAELRSGDRTAAQLAQAMKAPRTTLLHHLALLRSAGLLRVAVTPGDVTVYSLRAEGFRELSQLAGDFPGATD